MNENDIDFNDIILEQKNSSSFRTRKILLIVAIVILLFFVVVIVMRILNQPGKELVVNNNLSASNNLTKKEDIQNITVGEPQIKESEENSTVIKLSDLPSIKEEEISVSSTIVRQQEDAPKEEEPKVEKVETKQNEEIRVEEKIIQKTEEQKTQNKTIPSNKIPSGFYIQVASLSKYSPDKAFLSSIKNNGYSYEIQKVNVKNKTITRVLIGPFAKEADARAKLSDVKIKINSGAFIHHEK